MDPAFALCLMAFCLVLTCFLHRWIKVTRTVPPGPLFNPLGTMFGRTNEESSRYILGLRQKYGDVCCVTVLGKACIYLNSHQQIRKVFVELGELTSARLSLTGINHRLTAGRGVIFNDGLSWQEHRRFVLRKLKEFGFGCGGTEQIVHNELGFLLELFASQDNKPFDPRLSVSTFACNVISWLLFGRRCGSEPEFATIYEMMRLRIEERIKTHHYVEVLLFKCITRLLPPAIWTRLMAKEERIADYMDRQLNQHKQNLNCNNDCLMDSYLEETLSRNPSVIFNECEVLRTSVDLFIAGTDTTSSTILWAIFLMARYRAVQRAVQNEMDELLSGRSPTLADRNKMVYTSAVLMEIQRFATVTPFGALPHRCVQSFQLDKFIIPQDSLIFANIFAAHRDETIWSDAHHFNPSNFFDETSNSLRNEDYLIPFNVGRRSCLGESLAKQILFVMFASLLQNFELMLPDDETCTEDDCIFGNQRSTPRFKLLVKKR